MVRARGPVAHCKHLCGGAAGGRCPGPGSPRINRPTAGCELRANLRGAPAASGRPLTRKKDMRVAVRGPYAAAEAGPWARCSRRGGPRPLSITLASGSKIGCDLEPIRQRHAAAFGADSRADVTESKERLASGGAAGK